MAKSKKDPLCRYCAQYPEDGRKKCGHCSGYRLPSRREARRKHRAEA